MKTEDKLFLNLVEMDEVASGTYKELSIGLIRRVRVSLFVHIYNTSGGAL